MTRADSVVASDEDVQSVCRWVRLLVVVVDSRAPSRAQLPALAEPAGDLQLPAPVVGSALEQLAADGLVTLHDGYRLDSVGSEDADRVLPGRRPARRPGC